MCVITWWLGAPRQCLKTLGHRSKHCAVTQQWNAIMTSSMCMNLDHRIFTDVCRNSLIFLIALNCVCNYIDIIIWNWWTFFHDVLCICSSMYISLRWRAELLITSNSLWPSDIIWMHRTGAKWVQLMACCLMAPSHYLDQYWLINKVLWHSPEGDFTGNAQDSYSWCRFENKRLKNTARYPRHQWVNFKCNLSIDWSVKRDLTPSV